MINASQLASEFYPIDDLAAGFVRCGDELPKKTICTYFLLGPDLERCPFTVSEDKTDDDFAGIALETCGGRAITELTKIELRDNPYGFSHLLCVPHTYHSELKGRFDADRPNTTLCIPIFKSEFTGTETPEQFTTLRKEIAPTLHWDRKVTPKIALRFDNTKTGGGTGDGYVFVRFDLVLREIDNLSGVANGFIEIINYAGEIAEILFSAGSLFSWIPRRDDSRAETMTKYAIRDKLWTFLTQ